MSSLPDGSRQLGTTSTHPESPPSCQKPTWLWNKRDIHIDSKDGRIDRLRVKTKKHLPSREVNYAFDATGKLTEMKVTHTGYPFSITLQPLK